MGYRNSTRWYTSDQHFGHAKIIEYCDRPFEDVDMMNECMIQLWNDVVEPEDEVWILGDLSLGSLDENLTNLVSKLEGTKVLVPGNHDRCWHGHKKNPKGHRRRYYEFGGISDIIDFPDQHIIDGTTVSLCHFPYAGSGDHTQHRPDDRHERYAEHRPPDDGNWLLHGHIHHIWAQKDRQINVGVDARGFAPISEESIAAMVQAGPAYLDPEDSTHLLDPALW